MWNAGPVPGRIIEVITPGGFETYFRELGELLAGHKQGAATQPGDSKDLHESDAFARLAARYGLTYSSDWVAGLASKYNLKLLGQ